MGDKVIVSAEKLRELSAKFDIPRDTISSALLIFQNTIAALGKPWGDDEIGQSFESQYLPLLSDVIKGFTEVTTGLTELATDFVIMADNYENTEHSNVS